ncbi:tRNA (guanine-N(7)-)-methyltransferase [Alkalispirochaeta americana]|uniref:tRNA (guanine-N(7)-)-methyltransferase n=1 Tax=Alkalispirochaeta americana TaxID=159291 RepID=A0A1N6XDF1_9SPIO|nr:tRNA (guanosine(46)-N7)-methyltransferase TrmB [Alkalispirochaeta americana]SIR00375.1 tRNA (guanine-N(7)-)-methyltransferase [Alkalispirochaeta americana]
MNNIRSYVLRAARMSDHQKEAYEGLRDRFCIPVPSFDDLPQDENLLQKISWEGVFPHRRDDPKRPVIVDIGFGMGDSLADLAESQSDRDFLGVEVHKPGVGKLLGEIEERQLHNLRIARCDAVPLCKRLIPAESVDGVHLFFPDPWHKKRHQKRRIVREGFPELVATVLRPGGYLYMVTDWEDYARQMLEVMGVSRHFRNSFDGFAPPQSWRPETAFERKGLRKGHEIFELHYTRCE